MCIGFGFGPTVGSGPGLACPKSWRSGCEPATLATEPFPLWPPRARHGGSRFAFGGGDQVGEDGVTEAPLQATQCLFVRFSFF